LLRDGVLYIGVDGRGVRAITTTGHDLWQADFAHGRLLGDLAIFNRTLVVESHKNSGSHSDPFYVNALGLQTGKNSGALMVEGFRGYLASGDDYVYAYTTSGGRVSTLKLNESGVIVQDGFFSFGFDTVAPMLGRSGHLYVVDRGGSSVYRMSRQGADLRRYSCDDGVQTFLPSAEKLYVGSPAGIVCLIDATTQTVVWRKSTLGPVRSIAAADDGSVYVLGKERVVAIDPRGEEMWSAPVGVGVAIGRPTIDSGHLAISTWDGKHTRTFQFDRHTGDLRWEYESEIESCLSECSSPWAAVEGNVLYLLSVDGVLRSLGTQR
jgi:outer membrane protein assembly factor BamB